MRTFASLGQKKAVIGMVHLPPMPGTPYYEADSFPATLERAVADATALYEGGATGCLVQTIDRVYPTGDEADPARIAAVANIVYAISRFLYPLLRRLYHNIGIPSEDLAAAMVHAGLCGTGANKNPILKNKDIRFMEKK